MEEPLPTEDEQLLQDLKDFYDSLSVVKPGELVPSTSSLTSSLPEDSQREDEIVRPVAPDPKAAKAGGKRVRDAAMTGMESK